MSLCLRVDLKEKECVIFGGGKQALRRAEQLLLQKAKVRVYAPEFCSGWGKYRDICYKSYFAKEQLKGAFLVVAATNDERVNQQIVDCALQQGSIVISSTITNTPFHAMANRAWSRGIVSVSVPQVPALAVKMTEQFACISQKHYSQKAEKIILLRSLAKKKLSSKLFLKLMRWSVNAPIDSLDCMIKKLKSID